MNLAIISFIQDVIMASLEERVLQVIIDFDPEVVITIRPIKPRSFNEQLIDLPNDLNAIAEEEYPQLEVNSYWDNAKKQYKVIINERQGD
jgi:hypothetical protein